MTDDVSTRLAAGAPAVGSLETYVAACQALGRAAGGITVADVRKWYAAEAGLRLDALDSDSAALAGVASAAEEGVRVADDALAAIRQGWQGASGTAAAESLEQHLAGGSAVVSALRQASAALRALRVELGGLVDEKVRAAVRFDDRWAAEHPVWRPEAEAVLNGVADDIAVAVVVRQISPHVDGDVQSEWIPAMRGASDAVAAAYDDAVVRLSERPAPQIEGPGARAAYDEVPAAVPASPPIPTSTPPTPDPWASVSAAPWGSSPPWAAATPPWGAAGSMQWPSGLSSGMAAGLPDVSGMGGGLPALIARIADTLGSYADPSAPVPRAERERRTADPATDRTADPATENSAAKADPGKPDNEDQPGGDPAGGPPAQPGPENRPVGGEPVPQPIPIQPIPAPPIPAPPIRSEILTPVQPTAPAPQAAPVATVPAPAPLPLPDPPRAGPLPPPLAAEAGASVVAAPIGTPTRVGTAPERTTKPETPCSIAADELPQVGQ